MTNEWRAAVGIASLRLHMHSTVIHSVTFVHASIAIATQLLLGHTRKKVESYWDR